MMTKTSCILRASFVITFSLLSLCLQTSCNGEHEKALNTQTRAHLSHQFHFLETRKRLLEDNNNPIHSRKLGSSIKKKKKKKKKYGKKSSANHRGMSINHANSIFCISLLVSFVLII